MHVLSELRSFDLLFQFASLQFFNDRPLVIFPVIVVILLNLSAAIDLLSLILNFL